jgi:hypothetical protein
MAKKLSAKTARVRDVYAARTSMDARAAIHLAKGHFEKVEYTEDEDGNSIRVWKPSESSSYSNADLNACLSNRAAVEANEMLGTVPPSAIKYCVTKGWLIPHGSLYRVTLKAALELDLPMRFRGLHNGRKIPFAPAPSKKA